jgi:hypothetical protein
MSIKPGSLASFSNSMADAIEFELNKLMKSDGLPELNMDASDPTVRDRRRFFVAIARGVVAHLENRKDAIKVFCEHNQTKPVTAIDVDFS